MAEGPSLLISPDDPLWARPADGRLWPTNNDDDHNQYQHQEQDQNQDDGEASSSKMMSIEAEYH